MLNQILESQEILSALVGVFGTVLTIINIKLKSRLKSVESKLEHTKIIAKDTRDQVHNTHSTNLRDDVDSISDKVDRVSDMVNKIAGDVTYVRADMQNLRESADHVHLDHAARLRANESRLVDIEARVSDVEGKTV